MSTTARTPYRTNPARTNESVSWMSRRVRVTLVAIVVLASAVALLVACGKMDDGAPVCTWPDNDGGTIQCPADGKTACPSGYDCNTCSCNVDGTRGGCTTRVCP